MSRILTVERLREVLSYDPDTGVFRWIAKTSKFSHMHPGDIAGGAEADGRRSIRIDGLMHWAHRLAWLYMTGKWPAGDIDHRDTDPGNNRWLNMREATKSVNAQNRTKGQGKNGLPLGVSLKGKRFEAGIKIDGRRRYLGTFDTPAAAHSAYVTAKRANHDGCTL